MRLQVLDRDGHRCTWPGCNTTTGLEVHHVLPIKDRPDLADNLDNQVTLCKPHHQQAAQQYREAKALLQGRTR